MGAPLDCHSRGGVRCPFGASARRNRLAYSRDGGSDRVHARPRWRYARRLRRIGNPSARWLPRSHVARVVCVCRKPKVGRRHSAHPRRIAQDRVMSISSTHLARMLLVMNAPREAFGCPSRKINLNIYPPSATWIHVRKGDLTHVPKNSPGLRRLT